MISDEDKDIVLKYIK